MSLQKLVEFFKSRQLWQAVAAALIATAIIGICRHLKPKPDASVVPDPVVVQIGPNSVSQITGQPREDAEKKFQEEQEKQQIAKELEKQKAALKKQKTEVPAPLRGFSSHLSSREPTSGGPVIEAPTIKREYKPPIFISSYPAFRFEITSVKRTGSHLKFAMLIKSQKETEKIQLVEPEKTAYIVDPDGNKYFFVDAGGNLSYQSYQEFPANVGIKCYMTFLAPPPTVKEVSLIFKYKYGYGFGSGEDVTLRDLNLETLKPDPVQDTELSSPQVDINSAPTGEQQIEEPAIEYEYKPPVFTSSRSGFNFEIIEVKRSYDDSKLKFTMLIRSQNKTQLMKLVEPEGTAYIVDSNGDKYFFVSAGGNLWTGRAKEENERPVRHPIEHSTEPRRKPKPTPSYQKFPANVDIKCYMTFLAPPPTVKKISLVFTFAYDAGNENWWSGDKDDVIFKDLNLETLKLEATRDAK